MCQFKKIHDLWITGDNKLIRFDKFFDVDSNDALIELWTKFPQLWIFLISQRHLLQIHEGTIEFLRTVSRLKSLYKFLPTDQDMVLYRLKTVGRAEYDFCYNNHQILVIDGTI